MLLVAALTTLMIGSAVTYVEAKPKSKGNNSATPNPRSTGSNRGGSSTGQPPGQSAGQPTGQPGADTPGATQGVKNSGSIKIAQIGSGTEPNNDPKPGCTFRVDFYGFRAGTLNVTVSAIAPTGDSTLATDAVTLATSARGSQYQTSRTYDVSGALADLTASNQGYHLRVDAKRTDSNGLGSKTKVFWLNCQPSTGVQGTFFERKVGNSSARVLGLRAANGIFRVDGRPVTNTLGAGLAFTGTPLKGLSLLALALAMLGASLRLLAPRPHN